MVKPSSAMRRSAVHTSTAVQSDGEWMIHKCLHVEGCVWGNETYWNWYYPTLMSAHLYSQGGIQR